jgi:hypothetical protein
MVARHSHRRDFPGGRSPRPAQVKPVEAWRNLIAAVRALDETHGPLGVTALGEARNVAAGALFPVEGEDAKAGANALLELARTYGRTAEDARGYHREALAAVARYCGMRLDMADALLAAFFRRQSGDDR